MLSAVVAAILPIVVGILWNPEAAILGLACGAGGAIGTFLSGHRTRFLAVLGAAVGSSLLSLGVGLALK